MLFDCANRLSCVSILGFFAQMTCHVAPIPLCTSFHPYSSSTCVAHFSWNVDMECGPLRYRPRTNDVHNWLCARGDAGQPEYFSMVVTGAFSVPYICDQIPPVWLLDDTIQTSPGFFHRCSTAQFPLDKHVPLDCNHTTSKWIHAPSTLIMQDEPTTLTDPVVETPRYTVAPSYELYTKDCEDDYIGENCDRLACTGRGWFVESAGCVCWRGFKSNHTPCDKPNECCTECYEAGEGFEALCFWMNNQGYTFVVVQEAYVMDYLTGDRLLEGSSTEILPFVPPKGSRNETVVHEGNAYDCGCVRINLEDS